MIYVIGVLAAVSVVQAFLSWRLVRALRRLAGFEERLDRCAHGLALLVDTSEAGFDMLGRELGKMMTTVPMAQTSSTSTPRVPTAPWLSDPLSKIAAARNLSEGEVRLRKYLQSTRADSSTARAGGTRDTVRA